MSPTAPVAAIGAAPSGWRADRMIDARGLVVCPGPHRPVRAPARAGLRVQGHARIRDGRGGRRRRDEPRLSAGHRSAARRAGPRRDAEAPRALAQPGARLSDRRADGRARRRRAHRDGRARRGGLRRVLAGRGAADRTPACCCARCSTRRRSATACGCAPQDAHLGKGGVAHDGEVATRLGLPAIPPAAETIALASILALVRSTGVRVHLCRLSTAEGVAMVRAAKRTGLP